MNELVVKKEVYFEAAHRLRFHKGQCKNLHGHSYRVVVHATKGSDVQSPQEETGMVVDFKVLSTVIKEVIFEGMYGHGGAPFDHSVVLNEKDSLCDTFHQLGVRVCTMRNEPTAENMAKLFSSLFQIGLVHHRRCDIKIVGVDVWETRESCAMWRTNNDV